MERRAGGGHHPHGQQLLHCRRYLVADIQRTQRLVLHRNIGVGWRDEPEMSSMPAGDGRDGPRRCAVVRVRRRDRVRAAQQPAEQVRGGAGVEGEAVRAGQRQDHAEGLRAQEHAMVLRGGDLRRQGHQAHAE
nr:unnamed protein product [Callosobruchus analis]